jgi:hypothetical protein
MKKVYMLRDFRQLLLWYKRKKKKKSDRIRNRFLAYFRVLNYIFRYSVVEKLEWKSCLGLNEAMLTAVTSGGLWALKGMLAGFISSRMRLVDLKLEVEPDYNSDKLVSNINCIFKIRIAHIILIALLFVVLTGRRYLDGWTRTGGKIHSSYRRLNENSHAGY